MTNNKTIQAWLVVNKGFDEKQIKSYPNLYGASLFFTLSKAKEHKDELNPKFCKCCGKKQKPQELHVKIIEVEIKL